MDHIVAILTTDRVVAAVAMDRIVPARSLEGKQLAYADTGDAGVTKILARRRSGLINLAAV